MKTHVHLSFGGKELDCELEYAGEGGLNELEFRLVNVVMAMEVERHKRYKFMHIEDITEFLKCVVRDERALEILENLCIDAIQERGYL